MKKLYSLAVVVFLSLNAFAQFQVTLKVIDKENGALTNKVDDNNETNVIVYASDTSDNKLYDHGDWWYAMYTGEGHSPNGALVKADGVWTWQATFDVAPGEYKWNPHMKTLGWAPINNLYKYAEENDIRFSVATDGTISGTTTLELPLTPTAIDDQYFNNIEVFSSHQKINILNLKEGSIVNVINLAGALVSTKVASQTSMNIQVSNAGIYLINIDGRSIKVRVN